MKTYREEFRSPEKDSKEEAEFNLYAIRELHNETHGWFEIEAKVEQLPNGKWVAVRIHEKRSAWSKKRRTIN